MQQAETLLLSVLRAAPRRYLLPPLPADGDAARAAGPDTALAFAIEAARTARQGGAPAAAAAQALFTETLAGLIRAALAPESGDPAFQAMVLRAQDAEVAAHVRLAEQLAADARAVRGAVDALAHPGKLRQMQPGPLRDALAGLHPLAAAGAWPDLRVAIGFLLAQGGVDGPARAALQAILCLAELARLEQGRALRALPAVQRYLALCARRGPLAGSQAAAAHGRASARLGDSAEAATAQAFLGIADWLHRHASGAVNYSVLRSLRTPRGFPGAADKAKDEWDAAIVGDDGTPAGAQVVLLAEVKASPAAATPDFPRLVRGLQRLAHAAQDTAYAFPSADGEVRISGASLRRLQPHGHVLPPHVIYCSSAPAEAQPQVLGAATKAVLLAEPASLDFGRRLAAGGAPRPVQLAPVWDALLAAAPRLRSALHQFETAQAVRAAMLHPDDLLAAVAPEGR